MCCVLCLYQINMMMPKNLFMLSCVAALLVVNQAFPTKNDADGARVEKIIKTFLQAKQLKTPMKLRGLPAGGESGEAEKITNLLDQTVVCEQTTCMNECAKAYLTTSETDMSQFICPRDSESDSSFENRGFLDDFDWTGTLTKLGKVALEAALKNK